ncbi:uncharacterized protein LOC120204658 [Hibiscus syriacus]|uniref:uncharacterized protein LOC120204658 n=1 Tax=Hibiscus syriacus TaxID=106335 RepID=UPI001920F27F|nr:uncharacterized protein LOC120204658 [Hibiscus syriacus]
MEAPAEACFIHYFPKLSSTLSSHESVLEQGKRLCFEANCILVSFMSRSQSSHRQDNRTVFWSPPLSNLCKINTDGSRKTGNGVATCGVVLRSSNGRNYGVFYEGLSHAWNHGERQVMVEADSLKVIRMLQGKTKRGSFLSLLDRVVELLNRKWIVTLSHINWEANKEVDKLARIAAGRGDTQLIFYSPPPEVFSLIQEESTACNLDVEI